MKTINVNVLKDSQEQLEKSIIEASTIFYNEFAGKKLDNPDEIVKFASFYGFNKTYRIDETKLQFLSINIDSFEELWSLNCNDERRNKLLDFTHKLDNTMEDTAYQIIASSILGTDNRELINDVAKEVQTMGNAETLYYETVENTIKIAKLFKKYL